MVNCFKGCPAILNMVPGQTAKAIASRTMAAKEDEILLQRAKRTIELRCTVCEWRQGQSLIPELSAWGRAEHSLPQRGGVRSCRGQGVPNQVLGQGRVDNT